MLVMKFGGTSVGNAQRIEEVCSLVRSSLRRKPVVVVSAVARVTDALTALAKECAQGRGARSVQPILDRHDEVIAALGLDRSLLEKEYDELRLLAAKTRKKKKLDKKAMDHFQSFGERMSSRIVAAQLRKMGVRAEAFPAWELGMVTNREFGSAEPLEGSSAAMKEKIGALKLVPVITGFIGKTKKGEITTLGRGGSDYTAAIIGAAIGAEAIQIWKEVDGIMTTDPRIVPEARVVPELAFEEASELAYFGAKVLHPKAILPAMKKRIPVQVLNTFKPRGKGTTIVSGFAERAKGSDTVEAFTFKKNTTIVHVYSPEFFEGSGLLAHVFGLFEKYDTGIDIVSTSVASVSLTIDTDECLEKILPGLRKLGQVEVVRGKAIVCAVGGKVNAAGVAGRMFTALGRDSIPVEMISQAASGISMTFVVNNEDAEEAIRVLHKEYIG